MPERRRQDFGPRTKDGRLGVQNFAGAFSAEEVGAFTRTILAEYQDRNDLWADLKQLKFGKHKIELADEFKSLLRNVVRVPYALNTVFQYTDGLLHDGVRYKVPVRSAGIEAARESQNVSRWLTAAMSRLEREAPYRHVVRRAVEDLVSYGECAGKVMLAPDNWASPPRIGDYFEDGVTEETATPAQKREYETRLRAYYAVRRLPVAWRHVRAADFFPVYSDYFIAGMERSWRSEYDLMKRYNVSFNKGNSPVRGSDGKFSGFGKVVGGEALESVVLGPPISDANSYDGGTRTPSFTSSDDDTMPAAIAESPGGRNFGAHGRLREVWEFSDEWGTYVFISGKMVSRFYHGYGFCPYIHALARPTSDGGGEEASAGILRNMLSILPAFDRRLTMNEIASERNAMQYKIMTSRNPDARPPRVADGREPPALKLRAGEVPYAPPGYQLQTAVEQVAPDNTQSLLLYQQLTYEQGVSPAAVGFPGASSGYDRAQIRADFRISRQPFKQAAEDFCSESAWRVLELLERFVSEPIELNVGRTAAKRKDRQSFYVLDPSKDIKGERQVRAELKAVGDTDTLAEIESGMRLWQGIGSKRGISHRTMLEDFAHREDVEDELREISQEEFVDSEPVRTVLNKKAADEAQITEDYLDVLRAVQNKTDQERQLVSTATDVQGRGYGGTPGQESGVPGQGQYSVPPEGPTPPSVNGAG